LNVASSITAEGLYRKLGFSEFGREGHGEERLIRLEKSLGGPEAD
jgi:hypothetical protein